MKPQDLRELLKQKIVQNMHETEEEEKPKKDGEAIQELSTRLMRAIAEKLKQERVNDMGKKGFIDKNEKRLGSKFLLRDNQALGGVDEEGKMYQCNQFKHLRKVLDRQTCDAPKLSHVQTRLKAGSWASIEHLFNEEDQRTSSRSA